MSEQNRPEGSPTPPQDPGARPPAYGPGQQPPAYGYSQQPPSYAYGQPPPVPDSDAYDPTAEERTWALLAHIGTLVTAWFALGVIAPLATLLIKGDSSPFVRRHSIESLNFQISLLIYGVVAGILAAILTLVTLGLALLLIIPAAIIIGIALLVFVILATIRASNGEDYRYPFTLRLVS